jgi:hypothetical protein
MYYGAQGLIYSLQQWGVIDVILPFILIFTITFAVMEKIKLFSDTDDKNKKYSSVVALVLGMAIIIPHITGQYYMGFDPVEVINRALPHIGLLLTAIVMVLLTLGLWTGKRADGSKGPGQIFTLLSGALVIVIFVASMGWWVLPGWVYNLLRSDVIALVIALLVFGLIIKFITGSGTSPKDKLEADKERHKRMIEFLTGSSKDK